MTSEFMQTLDKISTQADRERKARKAASKEYNGHKDKGHWNIALWIGNEEPIYRFAMACIHQAKNERTSQYGWQSRAAHKFCAIYGGERTPDGFIYTRARVKAALADLDS